MTFIPVFFLIRVLVTTSSDSISNDYLRFTRLADRVLSAGYDWRMYMKDSMDNNTHSYAFLFLARLVLAKLTNLSIMAELYFGLAIAYANFLLIFTCLTRFTDSTSSLRFLLLPVLSAFAFSYSQISTYSYGEAVLQREFTHFGILVGLWMILFRSKSRITPWAIWLGGILSSFSGGGGLLAWPVFLFAILITKTGNLRKYLAWLAGLGISVSPYLAYIKINSLNNAANPYVINRMITGLGLPLANHIGYGVQEHPNAFLAGLIGIGLFIFATFLLILKKSKRRFNVAIPSFILVFWGISVSAEIGLFRPLLAPWYTSEYILFWLGLLGLLFGFIWPDTAPSKGTFLIFDWDKTFRSAGISGLVVIIILFLQSNLTYTDKVFFLPSRGPTSAACLRSYQIAPTYCENFIFQWGVGNPSYLPQMAAIIDKYNWSVFGPHQEWTLQGDYILGNVSLVSQTEPDNIRWVSMDSDEPSHWSDYHHLNVLLLPGQSILWQIDLPQNLSGAKLNIGLSLPDKSMCQEQNLSIRLESPLGSKTLVFQKQGLCNFVNEVSVNENLIDYAGKRLVIWITNESKPGGGQALRLHYPRVLIDEMPLVQRDKFTMPDVRPLNTDLSPNFLPINTKTDHSQIISTADPELHDLQINNTNGLMIRNGPSPSVRYQTSQPVCLLSWSHLTFNLALTDSVERKMVRLGLQIRYDLETSKETIMYFPLLVGENLHAYTLDFEILNILPSACITDIEFTPFEGMDNAPDQWIQIKDVGFLPRTALRFGFFQ